MSAIVMIGCRAGFWKTRHHRLAGATGRLVTMPSSGANECTSSECRLILARPARATVIRRWVAVSCTAVCSRCAWAWIEARFVLLYRRHLGVVGIFLYLEVLFGAQSFFV